MAKDNPFRVLIASDGSASARGAVRTATKFPWPDDVEISGVVAEQMYTVHGHPIPSLGDAAESAARAANAVLARRWPAARIGVVSGRPVDAILGEAKRIQADVIVMGWRGHGRLRRLLAGSVSRGVVRRASCCVLVVRRAASDVDRIVVGFDGSTNSELAVAFIARLAPPRRGRVTLVTVPEDIGEIPSPALAPRRLRAIVAEEGRRIHEERFQAAREALARPAGELARAGWKVDISVSIGPPLEYLLDTVRDTDAQLLAVGARGSGGVEHLLVGSVAQGALDRSTVPVLIAR